MSIAIRVEHLSKEYRLGVINNGMLYKDIQSWLARRLGKPDPHAQIGQDHFADREDRFWALKDLCFDIEEGDRVGIIGRNGAGKSTLLKILSKITAPTEGLARIRGRVASLLEVGTGFHGELTGRENIYLNGAILGMKKKEIDGKIDEIIAFSEIEQHIDTPAKRYSSGMYVRLAFAVAAHLDSEILIADEVLAVGDVSFQKKAIGKMNEISSGQGRTVLFVSHNMGAVRQLCTKGLVLNKGRTSGIGELDSSINEYLCAAAGVGTIWKNNSRFPRREMFEILEMHLTTADGLKIDRPIENTERVFFHMLFKCYSVEPKLTVGFSLFNNSGENIYRSLTTDIDSSEKPYFDVGTNHIHCELPIAFLKSGNYMVNADCSIHQERWLYDPEAEKEIGISLSIINVSFSSKHLPMGRIAPIVAWKCDKMDD